MRTENEKNQIDYFRRRVIDWRALFWFSFGVNVFQLTLGWGK